MIELLLQAERALTSGMLDQAEHLYWQAIEADPRNSIAVVGLARVALERKDDRTAYEFARKALAVDPDNVAAQRLATRMAEILRVRGELAAPEPKLPAPEPDLPADLPAPEPDLPADLPAPESAVAPVDARPGLFRRLIRRR